MTSCDTNRRASLVNMGKYTSLIYTLLLISMALVFYHVQQWSDSNRAILVKLRQLTENTYSENSEHLFLHMRERVISDVRKEIIPKMKDEINESFLPNNKQDHKLKLDLKYNLRDHIQKDITKTIKSNMAHDMKGITTDVVKQIPLLSNSRTYPENLCSSDKKLPSNQKLLVYTVFGTRKLYYEGIPEMLKEAVASNLYHDWRIRIYHDALITPQVIAQYKRYKNLDFCDARKLPRYGDITNILGKFWRNVPMADPSVDVMCSRDLDSSLLTREEDAVREFLKSDKLMHTMRDFPQHNAGQLAGMWCMKPATNRPMARTLLEQLLKEAKTYTLRTDQPLLNKVIFDTITDKKKYVMQHDSYLCGFFKHTIPFPTQRKDNMEFVGCPNHVCNWKGLKKCPKQCRPKQHMDWEYC